MKVQLEKTFALPASADAAWAVLRDVERVAGCMPGAAITERIDDRHYKGTVAVRFGPANMSFRGEVEVLALEPETRTLRLVGKGTDTTGSSAASMDLTARIDAVDAHASNLVGTSEVSMSGKAATFGGRMAGAVADQVLKQFAAHFAERAKGEEAQAAATAPQATTGAAPIAPAAEPPVPLNGLALAWAVLKDWLRSLLPARRA